MGNKNPRAYALGFFYAIKQRKASKNIWKIE